MIRHQNEEANSPFMDTATKLQVKHGQINMKNKPLSVRRDLFLYPHESIHVFFPFRPICPHWLTINAKTWTEFGSKKLGKIPRKLETMRWNGTKISKTLTNFEFSIFLLVWIKEWIIKLISCTFLPVWIKVNGGWVQMPPLWY